MVSITGDTETGKRIARNAAERSSVSTSSWAARRRSSSSTTPTSRTSSRTSASGATGTPARTARRRRASSPGRPSTTASSPPRGAGPAAGWGDPAEIGRPGHGLAHRSPHVDKVAGMVERASRAPRSSSAASAPTDRCLLRADGHRGARAGQRDRPGRGLRPRRHGAALQRRGRGHPLGQRRALRPGGVRLHADIGRAMRVAKAIQFGTVWINEHFTLAAEMPHGGFKQSGWGKDQSAYAIEDYTIVKHVMINIGALTMRLRRISSPRPSDEPQRGRVLPPDWWPSASIRGLPTKMYGDVAAVARHRPRHRAAASSSRCSGRPARARRRRCA